MINPVNILIQLLARREYSEYELRLKLVQKNIAEPEIDLAIEYVKNKNWQSDYRFTEIYIKSRTNKGYAKNKIVYELKQKGINQDLAEQVIDNLDIDWRKIAEKLILKKAPNYQELDFNNKQKLYRYLLSHGFEFDDFKDFFN